MTAAGTLELWEALTAVPPAARGAVVLVTRGAADDLEAASGLSLTQGAEAALAEYRERFGAVIDTVCSCPGCGAVMEAPLQLDALAQQPVAADPDGQGPVSVRAPTTADVLAARSAADPAAALRDLCASRPADADRTDLDPDPAEEVERLLGVAGLTARVTCPDCGLVTSADVDVIALLTDRIASEALRLLREVSELAGAYGWSQEEILRLSDTRRSAYLAIVREGR